MLQDVFKSVEKLCAEEGIDCAKFMYRDNTAILDTLEGGRCDPWGVNCLVDGLSGVGVFPWHLCPEGSVVTLKSLRGGCDVLLMMLENVVKSMCRAC